MLLALNYTMRHIESIMCHSSTTETRWKLIKNGNPHLTASWNTRVHSQANSAAGWLDFGKVYHVCSIPISIISQALITVEILDLVYRLPKDFRYLQLFLPSSTGGMESSQTVTLNQPGISEPDQFPAPIPSILVESSTLDDATSPGEALTWVKSFSYCCFLTIFFSQSARNFRASGAHTEQSPLPRRLFWSNWSGP